MFSYGLTLMGFAQAEDHHWVMAFPAQASAVRNTAWHAGLI